MVILALCTGVRCSELVALKWSDFDWENLSVYIRRAIVSGRVDDVKTEYSEAPLPLDPALAEVIFEWRRKTEFSAASDFVFASPFMAGEKPYTPWNMQHNHLSPAAVQAGLGPIGWHTLRHTYRAWLGDNGEPLTVQKELMRHASIQTTLNTYGGGMMESIREAHGRVVKQAMARQWTSVDVSASLKCITINKILAERVGFKPRLSNKINKLEGANGISNLHSSTKTISSTSYWTLNGHGFIVA
jgi:integrase